MDTKVIITIDGHSACGKSTLARRIAEKLDYIYLDTGAMYRAVTLFALRNNIPPDNTKISPHLSAITLYFNTENGKNNMFLNGENVEKEIRTMSVAEHVSDFSALPGVRTFCATIQKKIGKQKGIVADGRDMGTEIFPNAEIKFFITATAEERAKRRRKELKQNGYDISFEKVYKNIIQRDTIDTNRTNAPLIPADDAIIIDTTRLDLEAQFKLVLTYIGYLVKIQ